MSTISLGFFPTAVTEEKLEEAREKSLHRIFGTSETLRHIKSPCKVGSFERILQDRRDEHSLEGTKFFLQGEWEKAVTCYTKALNLDPKKVELYEQIAEAFIQLCDFQSAALHLRKAYLMSPMEEKYLVRLAFVLFLRGQALYDQSVYLDALESFTRASELQPKNSLYRMRSIACLAALKKYNDCLQMVNKEVLQEKSSDLFVLRARLYEFFGKASLCFNDLQEALVINPGHSEAQVLLDKLKKEAQKAKEQAVRKAVKGNLKAALLKINRAIEYNPMDANYFLFRGTILRRLKDFNEAIDNYLKAVELCTDREESGLQEAQKQMLLTYNDFAVHCYAKGFYEEAVLLLNKAIKGEKSEKGLYINRGDCFRRLGELNFAMADYQQALDLHPLDPNLQMRIAWLHNEMGLQEFRERRYPKAELYFSRAIESNPHEPQYYLHRSKSRMFLQEVLGAKEDIIAALLLDSTSEEVSRVARNLFPGESTYAILNSKVGDVAKARLDQRLRACPSYEPSSDTERLTSIVENRPEDVCSQKEKRQRKHDSEEKRLCDKVASCWRKSNKVTEDLKEARKKKASLEPNSVRLDTNPQLPAKECPEKPYQWRKFNQGIGHF